MSMVSVSTPFNIHLQFSLAAVHKRILAWVLDIIILLVYAQFMGLLIGAIVLDKEKYPIGINIVMITLPLLFYNLVTELVFQGQSFGKRAVGIRVLSMEGGEPNIGQYLMRWIFRVWEWPLVFGFLLLDDFTFIYQVIACFFTGIAVLLAIAITPKNQRLGDLAAGTTVVETKNQFSLDDTVFRDIKSEGFSVQFPEVMKLSDRDINAIKTVVAQTRKTGRYETTHKIAAKVKEVLQINSNLEVVDFLEKLLQDYNYLATKND